MAVDDQHALELLYSLAQKQSYRQPASYSPPWFEFKPMFKETPKVEFVPNSLLKFSRRWQPDPGPQKN
jgi:hypothetical protein